MSRQLAGRVWVREQRNGILLKYVEVATIAVNRRGDLNATQDGVRARGSRALQTGCAVPEGPALPH